MEAKENELQQQNGGGGKVTHGADDAGALLLAVDAAAGEAHESEEERDERNAKKQHREVVHDRHAELPSIQGAVVRVELDAHADDFEENGATQC